MRMKSTCEQGKQLDLVDYLAWLGHLPKKIRNEDDWFVSPLREEKTPSFKVNRNRGIWFDFGMGKGGDIIDFGVHFYRCSVAEWLQRMTDQGTFEKLSFQPQQRPFAASAKSLPATGDAGEKEGADSNSKIAITGDRSLGDPSLILYLEKRSISRTTAAVCCREVDFALYEKKHTAIGFPNRAGGYELRSRHFKGSSSPKEVTFVDYGSQQVTVFEGFFNFLSYQMIRKAEPPIMTNFLVLNSLSLLEKSRSQMELHDSIHLFFDRDLAGLKRTAEALTWSDRYRDESLHYRPFKDLNDYLVHQLRREQQQGMRSGGRL